jgi:hypothetical protein
MAKIIKSSIKFGPAMYRMFRHIPNTAWNALCEFVDNSIQACLDSINQPYIIEIVINNNSITIYDNGPGFSENDLESGLEPARIPKDKNQLNEFGMGMKLAALYFGDRYCIETSNGEGFQYELKFDLDEVVQDELLEIPIIQKTHVGSSFTRVTIDKLSTDTKINVDLHLTQIISKLSEVYSFFINENKFIIKVNNHSLTVSEIPILIAPWWKNENDEKRSWVREFNLQHGVFGISGQVALRDPMNNANRGFKLIRRGRVVDGIQKDVKPHVIFGSPGSHLSKRLIGNIHLHGFGISFNKADILNNNELETLWGMLKNELNTDEFPILDQGRNYRIGKLKTEDPQINNTLIRTTLTNTKLTSLQTSSHELIESFTLQIGQIAFTVQKGTSNGKFVQSENPIVIFRADFFTSETIRNKVIQILHIFYLNTNNELDKSTIVKLIDLLWPLLK